MKRYVMGLIAVLVVAGFWMSVGPDGIVDAQSGCASQGAVSSGETALAADCEVLLDIRDTLAGTATLNWTASTPMADRDGITVEGDPARVTEVNLVSRALSGTFPERLGNLSELNTLSLASNQLGGEIPAELGDLSNLEELYLSFNQLSGSIPTELGNLSSPIGLWLWGNQLTGTIPSELGRLASLKRMPFGTLVAGKVGVMGEGASENRTLFPALFLAPISKIRWNDTRTSRTGSQTLTTRTSPA